jgi:hypothetical protein
MEWKNATDQVKDRLKTGTPPNAAEEHFDTIRTIRSALEEQVIREFSPHNMEIYATTLHGNITTDVKKKKGGGRTHEKNTSKQFASKSPKGKTNRALQTCKLPGNGGKPKGEMV